MTNDPHIYQPDWSIQRNLEAMTRSRFAMEAPQPQSNLEDVDSVMGGGFWDDFATTDLTSFPAHMPSIWEIALPSGAPAYIDPIELDYRRFCQV